MKVNRTIPNITPRKTEVEFSVQPTIQEMDHLKDRPLASECRVEYVPTTSKVEKCESGRKLRVNAAANRN